MNAVCGFAYNFYFPVIVSLTPGFMVNVEPANAVTLLHETLLVITGTLSVPAGIITSVFASGTTPQLQLAALLHCLLAFTSQVTPNLNFRVLLVTVVAPVAMHLYL